MKKIIITLLLIILSMAFAKELQDVVRLKNGSVIRGTIVKQIPSKSISIETRDGNLFVYQMDEIEEIAKEEARGSSLSSDRDGKAYGLFNIPYAFGTGDDAGDTYMIGAKIIGGKQINNNFALGIGSGFNYMGATGEGHGHIIYLPLYADLRINFTTNETTPYLFVNPGYGFVASVTGDGDYSGGFYLNTGLGIRTKINESSDFDFSVSYLLQKTKLEGEYYSSYYDSYSHQYNYNTYSFDEDIKASYISIMLGFYFM